ncbi:MAG: YCF48-related protein [Candidatus Dormibacteraeota bacterium]|nr:YCF48-related protein [Candidatus Dormibacteraeota bacterium]
MDDFESVSRGRGRRALGLIAIGLALALVGGIVYLRPFAKAPAQTPAPTPAGHFNLPADMQWVSADEGWVVFNDGSNHSTLFHTRDAGRHWQRSLSVTDGHAAGFRFFDPGQGVLPIYGEAGGVRVLKTDDGGRSWQHVYLPNLMSGYVNVEFSDAQHAWLTQWSTQASTAGVPTLDLYRTADGGQHWQAFPNGALNGLPGPPSVPLVFASALDGWVQVGSRLYASHDGGDSWRPESLELPAAAPGASLYLAQAVVSPGGWAALTLYGPTPSGQVPPGVDIWVTASSDAGRTWQPPVHTPEKQSLDAGPDWYPPRFSDPRNGWLVVGAAIYTTVDSGGTWSRKAMPAGAPCQDVSSVSASTAWCAGRAASGAYPKASQVRLFRTVDGARHWTAVDPPI